MANTYTSLHYHFIFSTKNRQPWISKDIENRVWSFIGGIARKHGFTALQIGGVEDHIHGLISARPTAAPFQIAQVLKGESSKWIHEEWPGIRVSLGRMATQLSQLAGQLFQKWLLTLKTSASTIDGRRFRKSIWSF